ncbi:MAG: alpha/beta hydrolase [Chloroflexota bacterium]
MIYPAETALKRALKLMPNVEAALVADAGHAVNIDQPEKVNQYILAFLDQ